MDFKQFRYGFTTVPQLDGTLATSVKLTYKPENAKALIKAAKESGHLVKGMLFAQDTTKDGQPVTEVLCYAPKDHPIFQVFKDEAARKREESTQDVAA